MGYFCFNGINTSDYGIYVTGTSVYGVPARDYTQISVPGRNGDIFIDNGRYANIDITYHCEISGRGEGFLKKFEEFRRRLTASTGYQDLTDSYNPEYIRRGVMAGSIFPKAVGVGWFAGTFDITFNCMPQMFLKQGREFVLYTTFQMGNIDSTGADIEAYQEKIKSSNIPCTKVKAVKLTNNAKNTNSATIDVHFYNGNTYLGKKSVTLAKGASDWVSYSSTFTRIRVVTDWQNFMLQESEHYPVDDGWLTVIGDYEIGIFDRGALIYNETLYEAKPILKFNHCTNGATIKIGNYIISYAGGSDYLIIDCEKQTAYNTAGRPLAVTVTYKDTGLFANEFPSIVPGENKITVINAWNIQVQSNIYTL